MPDTAFETHGLVSTIPQDDWDFIEDISNKFPNITPSILDRFKFFDAIPREIRPVQALICLRDIKRQGLIQRGYNPEYVQSVYDHSQTIKSILRMSFKAGTLDSFLQSEKDPHTTLKNAFRKATLHDLQEVLTTDFTPQDMEIISRDDKARLETLAAKILYQSYPERYKDFIQYEHKAGKDDILVKMGDLLEWVSDAIISYAHPEHFKKPPEETLEGILSHARTKMKEYPEAYQAFGKLYLDQLAYSAKMLIHDIAQLDGKNKQTSLLELTMPLAA